MLNQNRIHTFAARKRGDEEVGVFIKEKEKAKGKKIEESFVEMKKNPHLCDPKMRGERGRERERERRGSGPKLRIEKRKKSFGKEKKVSTFADPNGRVLEKAKDLRLSDFGR